MMMMMEIGGETAKGSRVSRE